MSDLKRVALVTGGLGGIGKAVVEQFEKEGITVYKTSRREIREERVLQVDVRDEMSVSNAIREIVEREGRLDIVINNAGIASTSPVEDCTIEEWKDVIETNLTGTFLCCKHAIKHFLGAGGGVIVNISSIAGRLYSVSASEAYTCSKYGVIGLTRQLAHRYGKRGIRVNCVCPSQTLTEMLVDAVSEQRRSELADANPLGRLAVPADIAAAIGFLAGNGAGYINGACLDINGGTI